MKAEKERKITPRKQSPPNFKKNINASDATMTTTARSVTISRAIEAQAHKMTKIIGEIGPDDIDRLEEELGEIATTAKSGHFPQGEIFGHLPMIIREAKMRQILADPNYMYVEQADPGAYDPAAVAPGISAAQRAQMEGEHRKKQESYEGGIGVMEGLKTLIV